MQKKKLNPWSMVAILCAAGFCPLFTIAAVFLGLRALIDIKARGDTRGVRLAWFAIIVGSLVTGLWGGGMLWWNVNVRSRIEQGPIYAITQGQTGNLDAFTSTFITPSNREETARFLEEVFRRYGALEFGEMDQEIVESPVDGSQLFLGMVPMEAELSYVLQFERANIHLTGKFELFQTVDEGKQFVNRFAWIRFEDEDQGLLIYPVEEGIEELQN